MEVIKMRDVFSFDTSNEFDYMKLIRIKNFTVKKMLGNFFEKSVVSLIPHEQLIKLIDAINKDGERKIFDERKNVTSIMSEEFLASETHKIFLDIIKKNFGKSAYNLLKQRKNLNIFNLSEVHALHQSVFDELTPCKRHTPVSFFQN